MNPLEVEEREPCRFCGGRDGRLITIEQHDTGDVARAHRACLRDNRTDGDDVDPLGGE